MAGSEGPSATNPSNSTPKIILAKAPSSRPENSTSNNASMLMRSRSDDHSNTHRNRFSNHLVSDTWEFHADRFFDRLSDSNQDFIVIGVLGPSGAGKSTIMNELYGVDANTPGVLPPFPVQTEDTRAMARHCSIGIELRTSTERIILLDTQPVFSPSVLAEMMRPDGSSTFPVLSGETLSAELAHEIMSIQLGIFLTSVCHVLLVVTEGLQDISVWKLMHTVDMLKQGIPDPSLVNTSVTTSSYPQGSNSVGERDERDNLEDDSTEYFADPVFIHTKLLEHECSGYNMICLERALSLHFNGASFRKNGAIQYFPMDTNCNLRASLSEFPSNFKSDENKNKDGVLISELDMTLSDGMRYKSNSERVNFFVLPLKVPDDSSRIQHESYDSMLMQLLNQVLSAPRKAFAKPITERDWLRSAAKIWDMVKKSPVVAEYGRTLQGSGLYRRIELFYIASLFYNASVS